MDLAESSRWGRWPVTGAGLACPTTGTVAAHKRSSRGVVLHLPPAGLRSPCMRRVFISGLSFSGTALSGPALSIQIAN